MLDQYYMYKKIQITIVPRQVGEFLDEFIQNVLSQLTAKPKVTEGKPLTQLVSNVYNEDYNVFQGKCYQQFSPNLCGYHAIFNTFCFLKMLNGPTCEYDIESGSSFWKFKTKVQMFLMEMKRKHKLRDEWPWREKDILQGDFERTYNKICMEQFDQFSIFRKHQKFYYLSHTWEFQYENLIGQYQSKRDMSDKFAQFYHYDGIKPLVFHLMLAVTTHWLTFIAIKANGKTQFWFFDSFNNHYLDYGWQQIVDFVKKKSKDRAKYGKPEFTNFQKQSYSQCMKDIQISLKLIISCLEGKSTLQSYSYNRRFNIFADPFEAASCVDYESTAIVIKDYQHNIRQFYNKQIEWNLLNEDNHKRMKNMIAKSKQFKGKGKEGQYFYSLVRKWSKI